MKQIFTAEAIGLRPEEERRHRRISEDALRQANRDARPYVDELTGLMLSGAFLRQRLKPKADYAEANSRGTRGVRLVWTLEAGPVYHARYRTTWEQWHDRYLTIGPDGRMIDTTEEEARSWLENCRSASTS